MVGVPAVPCHAEVLPGGAVDPSRFALVTLAADAGYIRPDVTDADTDGVGTDLLR